jgi:hypothetical protein
MKSKVTFAVLADAHKVGDRGKVDCYGIFSRLGVWALPANRECSIVVGLAKIGEGPHEKVLWLRHGKDKSQRIGKIGLNAKEPVPSVVISTRIQFQIKHIGEHALGVSDGKQDSPSGAFWIPFNVHKLPWPEPLSGEALANALADTHSIARVGAEITCKKCQSRYKFEVVLDPKAKLSRGAKPFPASGKFRCSKCNQIHFLKDIEGQVRTQLGRSTSGEGK